STWARGPRSSKQAGPTAPPGGGRFWILDFGFWIERQAAGRPTAIPSPIQNPKSAIQNSPLSVHFRPAGAADVGVLLGFMEAFYAFDHLDFVPEAARAALEELLGNPSLGRVWLVCDDAEPVGYVVVVLGFSLEFHGRDAFLDELYLREDYRRRGIGRQALAFVADACRGLGVRALHLEVERANTSAQAVYRKAGFVDHDRYLMTRWLADATQEA